MIIILDGIRKEQVGNPASLRVQGTGKETRKTEEPQRGNRKEHKETGLSNILHNGPGILRTCNHVFE